MVDDGLEHEAGDIGDDLLPEPDEAPPFVTRARCGRTPCSASTSRWCRTP